MLVWQDMVSMYWEKPYLEGEGYRSPGEKAQFELEMRRMVQVCSTSLTESANDCAMTNAK